MQLEVINGLFSLGGALIGAVGTVIVAMIKNGGVERLMPWKWDKIESSKVDIQMLEARTSEGETIIPIGSYRHEFSHARLYLQGTRAKVEGFLKVYEKGTAQLITEGELEGKGRRDSRGGVYLVYTVKDQKLKLSWSGVAHFRHTADNKIKALWLARDHEEELAMGLAKLVL